MVPPWIPLPLSKTCTARPLSAGVAAASGKWRCSNLRWPPQPQYRPIGAVMHDGHRLMGANRSRMVGQER